MTPAARIESAITLLSLIEAGGEPPDRVAGRFFRERRFIGSKDRRAIGDLVYQVLRSQARLGWWCARATVEAAPNGAPAGEAAFDENQASPRLLMIAALAIERGVAATAALFDGSGYGPALLEPGERALAEALDGQPLGHPEQPDWVRAELPAWLLSLLRDSLGQGASRSFEEELAALGQAAPLDLRVNSLKADREAARQVLAADGIEAVPTPYAPLGLRVAGRHRLPAVAAFREGLVEVQDEGSQIVALLCDARPGLAVADLCAGAGGKTLALAAAMEGEGRLVALDIDGARLARARPRFNRAGLPKVKIQALADEDDAWLEAQAGAFDRVLVDAPCSGSGAWRRDPAARWRLTPTDLARYRELQKRVLALAAPLVKPGGRLIYATCSLLKGENQEQVAWFLERHAGFAPLALAPLWAAAGLEAPCPAPDETAAGELLLTPARHGTDGFYVAVLERTGPGG